MEKLLKGNDVAEYLNISRSKAYALIKEGKIPSIKIDGSVRVELEDLENYKRQNHSLHFTINGKSKLAAGTASDRKPQTNEVFHE